MNLNEALKELKKAGFLVEDSYSKDRLYFLKRIIFWIFRIYKR